MRPKLAAFGLLMALPAMSGCVTSHRFPESKGIVLETGTQAPVAGATVLASYMTGGMILLGVADGCSTYHATKTDEKGEFTIPLKTAWTLRQAARRRPRSTEEGLPMMRLARTASLLVAFSVLTSAASAFAESTEEMLTSCRAIAEAIVEGDQVLFRQDFHSGMCWGAFSFLQRAINAVDTDRVPLFHVCAPEKSTRTQLIVVFAEYARRNPQRLHEDFFPVVIKALSSAFPCQPR